MLATKSSFGESESFQAEKGFSRHFYHTLITTVQVDFVECLLENGVSMKSFLTIATLEQLYNLVSDFVVQESSFVDVLCVRKRAHENGV